KYVREAIEIFWLSNLPVSLPDLHLLTLQKAQSNILEPARYRLFCKCF
ncbi:hypothetical protein MXB_1107, partial [Myxobolus squamalis]